jgi:PBP1b-binding outer membrane lipoprotein LpoB
MPNIALMIMIAGFALAGCAGTTALKADYGHSVEQMTENQVYDRSTLFRPSVAAVEGADPNMIDLAVTTMRTQAIDRKEVSKPVILSIGGQGGQ